MTGLQEKLNKGEFVITTELCPPRGVDTDQFLKKAHMLKGLVDALNMTDNQRSMMRLNSIVASKIVLNEGIEPIFQVTCRDRNRIALQSDLLGAYVLGLRNVLVLTGDDISTGDHKKAKPVFDLESVGLLNVINHLNRGVNFNGKELEGRTDFYVGAAVNPCAEPVELQVIRMKQKIQAGAQFFQTQVVYDIGKYEQFLKYVSHEEHNIIVGVLILKSARMAHFINENVPGVDVPDEFIAELEDAADPVEKGKEIAVRLIEQLKSRAAGIHLMSVGSEELARDVLQAISEWQVK